MQEMLCKLLPLIFKIHIKYYILTDIELVAIEPWKF